MVCHINGIVCYGKGAYRLITDTLTMAESKTFLEIRQNRLFILSLHLTNISNTTKFICKHKWLDDFNFEIVNFPFLDGDVPRSPSYGVYISQLIHFARVRSNVDDFNNRNLFLTAKLLKQGYRYHKKIVSEYDQEIPQSRTAENPLAPRGRAAKPSRDTRKTN